MKTKDIEEKLTTRFIGRRFSQKEFELLNEIVFLLTKNKIKWKYHR